MATGSAHFQYNGTLTASTVDTITFDHYSRHVLVENLDTANEIYVVAATTTPADPTDGGEEEYAVAPGSILAVPVHGQWPSADDPAWPLSEVVVKVIGHSTSTSRYSLQLV